jgi:hypothetical protein
VLVELSARELFLSDRSRSKQVDRNVDLKLAVIFFFLYNLYSYELAPMLYRGCGIYHSTIPQNPTQRIPLVADGYKLLCSVDDCLLCLVAGGALTIKI